MVLGDLRAHAGHRRDARPLLSKADAFLSLFCELSALRMVISKCKSLKAFEIEALLAPLRSRRTMAYYQEFNRVRVT